MRLFNFSSGDPVRVTRTPLTGTIYQVGGQYALIETDQGVFRYPICRLRHVGYPLTRKLRKLIQSWK